MGELSLSAMASQSESAFLNTHSERLRRFWDSVKGDILNWRSQYEWPRGITGEAALSKRTQLEEMIRRDLKRQDFLSKATFDSIVLWGFGTDSGCSEEEIRHATTLSFRHLKEGRIAQAARELVKLPKVGISRATKVLALSDQTEFGIYDSRSAHGLSDLTGSAGRIIPIPPGRVIAGDNRSKDEYCVAFEGYIWVLRYLRRLAGHSDSLRTAMSRTADVEIALFTRSKRGDIKLENRLEKIPPHIQAVAEHDEESLFWTLGPGRKAKAFWVVFDGCLSATVLTGKQKTPKTLTLAEVDTCLKHFGYEWFPLSNSKVPQDRDPRGLGEYFARNFGSSVFASHFAALWVYEGRLECDFRGTWWFRVPSAS
jgi:hypothetical protein